MKEKRWTIIRCFLLGCAGTLFFTFLLEILDESMNGFYQFQKDWFDSGIVVAIFHSFRRVVAAWILDCWVALPFVIAYFFICRRWMQCVVPHHRAWKGALVGPALAFVMLAAVFVTLTERKLETDMLKFTSAVCGYSAIWSGWYCYRRSDWA